MSFRNSRAISVSPHGPQIEKMPPVKITAVFKPKNLDKESVSLEQPVEQPDDEPTPAKRSKRDETDKVEFEVTIDFSDSVKFEKFNYKWKC